MKFSQDQLETIKEELTFIIEVMKGQELPPNAKKRISRIKNVLKVFKPPLHSWILTKTNKKGNEVIKRFSKQPTEDTLSEFPRKMIDRLIINGEFVKGKTVWVLRKV